MDWEKKLTAISITSLSPGPHESSQQNSSTETSTGGSLLQRALKKERVWERIQRRLQKTGRQPLQAREQHTRSDRSCCQRHKQEKLNSFKKRHRRQAPMSTFKPTLERPANSTTLGSHGSPPHSLNSESTRELAQQVEALYIGLGSWAWASELMRKARRGAMHGSPSNWVRRPKIDGIGGPVSPAESVLYGPLVREHVSTKQKDGCLKTTFAAPKPTPRIRSWPLCHPPESTWSHLLMACYITAEKGWCMVCSVYFQTLKGFLGLSHWMAYCPRWKVKE